MMKTMYLYATGDKYGMGENFLKMLHVLLLQHKEISIIKQVNDSFMILDVADSYGDKILDEEIVDVFRENCVEIIGVEG